MAVTRRCWKAAEAKLLRTSRLRADTTVVPADVAYPTDSRLLAKAVRRIAAAGRRAADTGRRRRGPDRVRDRSRSAVARARAIGAKLRAAAGRDQAQNAVRRITGRDRSERRHPPSEPARRRRPPDRQGPARPAGGVRVKAQLVDNDDGVVVDHTVERGNPADGPQLAPAVQRVIRRAGRPPRAVTADRGYGEAAVGNDLHDLGVRTVVIPRKHKPGKARRAHEHRPAFRRTVKWRTGSEARISTLKRQYGLDRSRLDHLGGARMWTGQAVLAHNLVKIAALAA